MPDNKLQFTRGAAIALLILMLAVGGLLATLISGWIGHPVLAATSAVPVYEQPPVLRHQPQERPRQHQPLQASLLS